MIGSRNSLGTNCVGTGPAAPIKSRFTLVLLLACALAGALSAQEAPNLEEKPRSNLVIRVEGATRDWEVMPVALMYRSGGKGTIANSQGLLKLDREKWPSTGAPKRYRLDDWRKLFQEFTGADERAKAANFEFQARNPRAPNLQGVVTEKTAGRTTVYVVPADKVKIIGYPQTWINIYEDYVNKVQGPERRVAVKMWEEAFRSTIENPEQVATGFSTEERNEFAQFYQRQFEFIRNENPQDPAIYQELADYHRTRGNLDAELSIYLDGIANGVPSPKLEEFALSVGRIFVTRLALYPEAIAYLDMASAYAEARYLKARCQIEMGQTVAARATLRDLLAALAQGGETALVTTLSAEDENGRANLMLARVEFDEVQFKPAEATIKLIPAASQSYQEGQVLLAAMLTQRGLRDDHQKVKEVLDPLKVVLDGKKLKPEDPNAIIPFDPLMSQALVLYAQTDAQFRQAIDPKAKPQTPNATILTLLNVAKATDPLSGEPYLAEGRLKQRLGDFVGALEAYNAGLVIEPNSVRLNYSVASLKNKAGALDEAKDLCSRCLRQDARFHPALVMLGEIAISELDRLRENLISRRAAGEAVDIEAELLPVLKEAAAFLVGALEVQPNLPAVKLTLASLYLQLAEIAPATINSRADADKLRRAYLSKARDLALELMGSVRKLAERTTLTEDATLEEIAATPTPACFNVYAFACYSLGDFAPARQALEEHLRIVRGPDARKYFATAKVLNEYRGSEKAPSPAVTYAERWLAAIRANERQFVERDNFEGQYDPGFYGQWNIVNAPKADLGFMKSQNAGIKKGDLVLGVDKQRESDVVSRLSAPKDYATLTRFAARLRKRGDIGMFRGIALTRLSTNTGKGGAAPTTTVMLGVDPQGQVFWQVRKFKLDDQAKQEEVIAGDLIDIRTYNGPIGAESPLNLALLRRMSKDRSSIVYVAVVNGYEIELPLPESASDARSPNLDDKTLKIGCDFFMFGVQETGGEMAVEGVEFVFDSGLGKPE